MIILYGAALATPCAGETLSCIADAVQIVGGGSATGDKSNFAILGGLGGVDGIAGGNDWGVL